MIIKVIRHDRHDCVKVTNNNVTITDLSDLLSDIEEALKYWEELDRNAVRLDLESLNGKK